MPDTPTLNDILTALRAQDADLHHVVLLSPAPLRAPLATLFWWDATCASAAVASPELMVNLIRLAWWREQVEALSMNDNALPAPLLSAMRAYLLPAGLRAPELAALEAPWADLLEGEPPAQQEDLRGWCCQRGGTLFDLATRLLAPDADSAQRQALHQHGHIWALAQWLRSHALDEITLPSAPPAVALSPALRPLAALGTLALRDIARAEQRKAPQPKTSPARLLRLLFTSLRSR